MSVYPNEDIRRFAEDDVPEETREALSVPSAGEDQSARAEGGEAQRCSSEGASCPAGARIVAVEEYSPADDAGFEPGCFVTAVDGQPVRDIIDWRWLAADDVIDVSYVDLDGEEGTVTLEREDGESWGFEFDGLIFDRVKLCRNACTFCFMHQLPAGMRPSLSMRDDDFRLSFLVGTFVTLTNITPEDEQRIVEQRISPLRVSLQAVSPDVRARLIGKHAQHGLDVLDRLLAAGIEFHAQIVLVPGANDGKELVRTLGWAYERPGILDVGIVPLGYTRHQERFASSFNDPDAASRVLEDIAPFQRRALEERGGAWVYAADEFYGNAFGGKVGANVPAASFYGDFALFEDGIGIVRSVIDDWEQARAAGTIARCAGELRSAGMQAVLLVGVAQRCFLDALIAQDGIADVLVPLYVENAYFGGNVDVTGLLVGEDIVRAVRSDAQERTAKALYLVQRVIFNDDGVTLDDMTVVDMEKSAGCTLHVVSLNPQEYLAEIAALARASAVR